MTTDILKFTANFCIGVGIACAIPMIFLAAILWHVSVRRSRLGDQEHLVDLFNEAMKEAEALTDQEPELQTAMVDAQVRAYVKGFKDPKCHCLSSSNLLAFRNCPVHGQWSGK